MPGAHGSPPALSMQVPAVASNPQPRLQVENTSLDEGPPGGAGLGPGVACFPHFPPLHLRRARLRRGAPCELARCLGCTCSWRGHLFLGSQQWC